MIYYAQTKLKDIKKLLRKKETSESMNAKAVRFWKDRLDMHIDERIWNVPKATTKEVRLRELQWKILHNIYPTKILLEKMKVTDNNKCDYCPESIDSIDHFFYECKKIKDFWSSVSKMLSVGLNEKIILSRNDVLLGIPQNDMAKAKTICVNHVILIGKMCISIVKKTKVTTPLLILLEIHLKLRKVEINM